jgi:L-glyceraldehyde 3-phosphate reductase
MTYQPRDDRYSTMTYRRSGRSGLLLPALSLGLWQNFGDTRPLEMSREIIHRAFDLGITHFDLANNYGPPYGSAEATFGRVFAEDLAGYRDELVISTKAGYDMWPGPYGDWGSRKYLLASLDQSLARMGIEYVDIFYAHRFDPETPLEETMGALESAVRLGKALYAGVSSYTGAQTREAVAILRRMGTPLLIHQPSYSMLNRWIETDLLDVLGEEGVGCIVFSPLSQGCSPTATWAASPPARGRAALARCRQTRSRRASWRRCGRSTNSPGHAVRAWPRWRWPGPYAMRASPPPSSARAASSNWSRTWARLPTWISAPTNWARSIESCSTESVSQFPVPQAGRESSLGG